MPTQPNAPAIHRLGYAQRAELCSHPVSRTLFRLMAKKQTNLAVSADLTQGQALLELAEEVGPHICVLKTHVDILEDYTPQLIEKLQSLSEKHGFLLFEDRKFADIGHTVKQQYQSGIYRISNWAHIVNAHALPGPGVVEGLREVGLPQNRGLLLLAEMSSKGNLAKGSYTQATVELAHKYPDFVMGYISQHRVCQNPTSIHFTPGVKLEGGEEALGQQWQTPQTVIKERGTDIMIVGRGIYQSSQPGQIALTYKEAGWQAYLEALPHSRN